MEEKNKVPMLLEFLFGEAAETVRRGASPRLMRWAEAFDEWLAEQGRRCTPSTNKQAKITWRRLLRERGRMPWELSQKDIEGHAAWMEAENYAATTISNALGIIAAFYRWCDERQIDPECEAGFNPAAGVRRPKRQHYAGAKLLSRGEVEALLGILGRDDSALGKRDYAFILARLRTGVALKTLQQLQWGQLKRDEDGVPQGELPDKLCWVRWREEAARTQLPGEVWDAIRGYLAASGRLAGMQDQDYIFAPLAEPGIPGEKDTAGDWVGERYPEGGTPGRCPEGGTPGRCPEGGTPGRCLSSDQILRSLKLYGRAVKIPEEKLTLQALRRTAIRLRLDEGDSIEEMQSFLDSKGEAKFTKYRLGMLPQLPVEGRIGEEGEMRAQVPDRKAKPFRPGERITHGYYQESQPEEEVLAVLAEDIQGIEEEIAGLRRLARRLVAKLKEARSNKETGQLVDTHSLAASRLGELIEAEKQLTVDGVEDTWAEETLARLDKGLIDFGERPVSEALRAGALEVEPELAMAARCLVEEIAAVRYMLRNVLGLALQTQETAETIRLVEIYGSGCARLVRMLKKEGSDQSRLERYIREAFDEAIRELNQEWGM